MFHCPLSIILPLCQKIRHKTFLSCHWTSRNPHQQLLDLFSIMLPITMMKPQSMKLTMPLKWIRSHLVPIKIDKFNPIHLFLLLQLLSQIQIQIQSSWIMLQTIIFESWPGLHQAFSSDMIPIWSYCLLKILQSPHGNCTFEQNPPSYDYTKTWGSSHP